MRIGILPCLDRSTGGIYQYSVTMLDALHSWKETGCEHQFVVFASPSLRSSLTPRNGRDWTVASLNLATPYSTRRFVTDAMRRAAAAAWRRLAGGRRSKAGGAAAIDVNKVVAQPHITQQFRRLHVDLAVYPFVQPMAFEADIPFVVAVHDLQHRLQPEFPEVSANGEWEWREYLYRNGTRSATLILADSEVGKEDILRCYGPYGVTPDRVKVLPFLAAPYLGSRASEDDMQRVRAAYQLPERYLFYPAQFWAHKNHTRIVQALGQLRHEYRLEIPIVFCGSHAGELRERTFQEVMSSAARLGVERQIFHTGYVPDEDMAALYAGAAALVMPTFFGPTNIPVIEAWAHGCPVLTSDIRGIREQVGDAGILVDPRSIESIADGISRLWTDQSLSQELARRGHRRLGEYTPDDYRARLVGILEEAGLRARQPQRLRKRAH